MSLIAIVVGDRVKFKTNNRGVNFGKIYDKNSQGRSEREESDDESTY